MRGPGPNPRRAAKPKMSSSAGHSQTAGLRIWPTSFTKVTGHKLKPNISEKISHQTHARNKSCTKVPCNILCWLKILVCYLDWSFEPQNSLCPATVTIRGEVETRIIDAVESIMLEAGTKLEADRDVPAKKGCCRLKGLNTYALARLWLEDGCNLAALPVAQHRSQKQLPNDGKQNSCNHNKLSSCKHTKTNRIPRP